MDRDRYHGSTRFEADEIFPIFSKHSNQHLLLNIKGCG